MKKLIYLFLLLPIFINAQDLYWLDVMVEIPRENQPTATTLINEYYSSINIPSDISISFSSIPFKGVDIKATHILSMFSPSAESLANFWASLGKGDRWNMYSAGMRGKVKPRGLAGNVLVGMNYDKAGSLGQVWLFKVHAKDRQKFVSAFSKLMKIIEPKGLIACGQITHGNSNGESMFIYSTSESLIEAISSSPSNKKEADAFQNFFDEISFADLSQSFTRSLIKEF